MKNLGSFLKELREKKNWPQRKLAYELDIDVSVLSRIENENKFPKKRIGELISCISRLFEVSINDLTQMYLSDEIASLLVYEDNVEEILRVANAKINYLRSINITQSQLEF